MSDPSSPRQAPRTSLVIGSILGVGVLVCGGGGLLAAAGAGVWYYLQQPQAVRFDSEDLLVDSAQGKPVPTARVQRRRGEPEIPPEPVTWTVTPSDLGRLLSGTFMPDRPGDGQIQACTEGICGTLPVHVIYANGVTVEPDRALIRVWGTRALKATPTFEGRPVDVPITWTSSDPKVATVDASGTVTPVGAGTVEVTAAAGGASAKASVRVIAQAPNPCTLSKYADAIGRVGQKTETRACPPGAPELCEWTASQNLSDGGRIDEGGGLEWGWATLWIPGTDAGQAVGIATQCLGLPPEVTALPLLEMMQGATPGEQKVHLAGDWDREGVEAIVSFKRGSVSVDLPVACASSASITVEGNWIKLATSEGC